MEQKQYSGNVNINEVVGQTSSTIGSTSYDLYDTNAMLSWKNFIGKHGDMKVIDKSTGHYTCPIFTTKFLSK